MTRDTAIVTKIVIKTLCRVSRIEVKIRLSLGP